MGPEEQESERLDADGTADVRARCEPVCRDCCGLGEVRVPGAGAWRTCPTCDGSGVASTAAQRRVANRPDPAGDCSIAHPAPALTRSAQAAQRVIRIEIEYEDGRIFGASGSDAAVIWWVIDAACMHFALHGADYQGPYLQPLRAGRPAGEENSEAGKC